jgi:5-methylthioadenosine/S-adenosylhomocysteine deaminase
MPPESVDLLIEPRWVLPIAPANTVLADHAVAISAGRIVALGPIAQMNARFDPRERAVRQNHALLPGFVNGHTSAAMTLFRGLPVRAPRARWLRETVLPAEQHCMSPDFVRDGTHLAIAEMVRAGITCFADRYSFPEEAARTAAAARIRAVIGLPLADTPGVWADSATAYFAKAERLWDEYRSDPWVGLYFAPHEASSVSDETLARVRRVADELDARIAMHVHATEAEVQESLSLHGRRPLQRLHELGLLQPGFTAVHMNRLNEEDLDLVARTGISVVACTQSDLRLGSGSCPVRRLDMQQVTVGLGTSDPASAGVLDMLSEARVAALIANGALSSNRDPGYAGLPAADALRMATLGGAIALGLGAVIGSIEPGKAADLVCWDLGTPGYQLGDEPTSPVADTLLFGITRRHASDVWTSGRAAVNAGQLLTFDEQELATLAQRWAQRVRPGASS